MSIIISCTGCERKLRVPDDLLGKQVICPSCSLQFTAAAVGGGETSHEVNGVEEEAVADRPARRRAEDDYDDRPVRRSRREEDYDDRRGRRRDEDDYDDRRPRRRYEDEDDYDDRRPPRRRYEDDYDDRPRRPANPKEGWKKVGLGLTLVGVSNWLAVGTLGIMALAGIFAMCGLHGTILTVLAAFRMLTLVGEVILLGIGSGLFLVVPLPPRGTSPLKPLGLTTFILVCVQALLLLISSIVDLSASMVPFATTVLGVWIGAGARIMHSLEALVALAAIILLLLFLRSVAAAIREKHLGDDCQHVIMGFAGSYGLGGATFLVQWIGLSSMDSLSSIKTWEIIFRVLGGIAILVAICVRIWFFMVLGNVKREVYRFRRRL